MIKKNQATSDEVCDDLSKINRFEVIDKNGRAYTNMDCKITLSFQDEGRTMKVFIEDKEKRTGAICGDGMCPYVPCPRYPDCEHVKSILEEPEDD